MPSALLHISVQSSMSCCVMASAMNVGTPIGENDSAITCMVTVLPVPVAPVMTP
jgi:hypothetical protein